MTASARRTAGGLIGLLALLAGQPATPATHRAPPAAAASPQPPALALSVRGNQLIDAQGHPLQLRGASISGLENTAVQGWAMIPGGYNYWGDSGFGGEPDFTALSAWHMNAVRLPLNESSWLGAPCNDPDGRTLRPDPAGEYRKAVQHAVTSANAAGLYVILDLHWAAPAKLCATGQGQMADADHSPAFWQSVAQTFKDNPAVLFELFNEPFGQNVYPVAASDWVILRNGGTYSSWIHQNSKTGALPSAAMSWQAAGMQSLLDAVRAAQAHNVVLVGTMGWNGDLSQWLRNRPTDPLNQMAVAWHVYPWNSDESKPAWTGIGDQYAFAAEIMQQFPLVITETGFSKALAAKLMPWSDASGASYLVWSWNPWGSKGLIHSAEGDPTPYGQYFKSHLECIAGGAGTCP